MVKKGSLFIIGENGAYLDGQRGTLRALDNFTSVIQVLAPFDITTVVEVSYLIYGASNDTVTQYMAPTTFTGEDVLASSHSLYQTCADWVLWEIPVTSRALAKISKYKAGQVGISFSFKERFAPEIAETYVGTFGLYNDLPATSTDNYYYVCDAYNYVSAESGLTFTKNDVAVWVTDTWLKPTQYTLTANTVTMPLSVSAAMSAVIATTLDEDDEFLLQFASMQGDINQLVIDVDAIEAGTSDITYDNSVSGMTAVTVQTAIDELDAELDDIKDGTTIVAESTRATQDASGNVITTTYATKAEDALKELLANKTTTIRADGVADNTKYPTEAATRTEIDGAKSYSDNAVSTHNSSVTAHTSIRTLIEALQLAIQRLDGRGVSYGEIPYETAYLIALDASTRNTTITAAIQALSWGSGYTPTSGDLVYDEGVGAGVDYHEWEYNGTNWVDNGAINSPQATDTIYGNVKGDGTYLSIVAGLVQVLLADYATAVGASGASYTYAQIYAALQERPTLNVVTALLDSTKLIQGVEETTLGAYTNGQAIASTTGYDKLHLVYRFYNGIAYEFSSLIITQAQFVSGIAIFLDTQTSVMGCTVEEDFAVACDANGTLYVYGIKYIDTETDNVVISTPATESPSGTGASQAAVNIEVTDKLSDIVDGTIVVAEATKATNDEDDNNIKATYETIAHVDEVKIDVIEHEKRIDTLEENFAKSQDGELTGTVTGTQIVSLPKDTATAPLKVKVEGLALQATNQFNLTTGTANGVTYTISGNQITLTGTATAETTLTLASGLTASNKAYVNNDYISGTSTGVITLKNGTTALNATYNTDYSGVVTLEGTTITLVIANGAVLTSVIYKVNIDKVTQLISNKQYSPISATTFDLMSDAQIKAQMDYWVFAGELPNDNLQSVGFNKRIKATGKNLFDYQKSTYGYRVNETTGGLYNTNFDNGDSYSEYIKVKPSTSYKWSGQVLGTYTPYAWYDINKVFISGGYTKNPSLTSPSNAFYLRISSFRSEGTIVMLELGSTATTYEAYRSSELYIEGNAQGYSLPNGTKDSVEYRNGKMYRIKRLATASVTGVVAVNTTNYPLAKNTGQFINYFTTGGAETGVIGTNSTSADGFLIYELATPVETELSAAGNLIGSSSGSVTAEDILSDADIYDTKADITNTSYPISSLARIVKANTDDSSTELAVSGATVAGDGLSFTHTSLTAGDHVWFSYYYSNTNNINGLATVTYFDNKFVVVDTVTSAVVKPKFVRTNGVWSIADDVIL